MDNSTVWQPNYDRAALPGPVLRPGRRGRLRRRHRVGQAVLRAAVLRPLQRRRQRHRLGQGAATTRPATAASNGYPVRRATSAATPGTWSGTRRTSGSPTRRPPASTDAEIKAELTSFDQWDRYDFDDDGNFNEPDGYIDHFQIVHAGGDQADGDPIQGEDAIWSHRWYAYQTTGQRPGGQPGRRHPDRRHRHLGRRLHDPAGERRPERLRPRVRPRPRPAGPLRHLRPGGENGVNYWSLMAQSREAGPNDERHRHPRLRPRRLGQAAARLARLRDRAARAEPATARPRPARVQLDKAQAAVVVLPKKQVTTDARRRRTPARKSWWSGTGDDLDATMSRQVTLPAGAATLTSRRTGTSRTAVRPVRLRLRRGRRRHRLEAIPGNITDPAEGNGIDGDPAGAWTPATLRPVGVRRQDGRPAAPLRHRRRRPGNDPA